MDCIQASKLPAYNTKDRIQPYTDVLKGKFKSTRILNSKKYSWHTPCTIDDLQSLLHLDVVGNGAGSSLLSATLATAITK